MAGKVGEKEFNGALEDFETVLGEPGRIMKEHAVEEVESLLVLAEVVARDNFGENVSPEVVLGVYGCLERSWERWLKVHEKYQKDKAAGKLSK